MYLDKKGSRYISDKLKYELKKIKEHPQIYTNEFLRYDANIHMIDALAFCPNSNIITKYCIVRYMK